MGISKLKDHMQYILVYNENVNAEEKEVKNKSHMIQPSDSFDNFAKIISKQAKSEYVCFGVKILKTIVLKMYILIQKKSLNNF